MKKSIKIIFAVLLVIGLVGFTLAVTPPQVFGFNKIINLSDGYAYFDKILIGDPSTPLDLNFSLEIIGDTNLQGDFNVDGNISLNDTLFVTNDGDVGIGTTNPSSKLDVQGDFKVNGSAFFVNATSDFVGIRTATPQFPLDIRGIVSISAGSARIELEDILVNGSDWWILPSTGGTTDLFRIYDRGEDADRLVINSVGDVGIGTVSPSAQLHIKGSGNDGILLERSAVDQNTEILFTNELEVEKWAIHFDGSAPEDLFIYPEVSAQDLILQANETGTAFGNVGIGISSPAINLHVLTSGSSGLGSTPANRGIAITGIGGRSRLYFEATDAPSSERVFVIENNGGILRFGSLNDTASAFTNENILILDHDTGNVGIGTSSPTQKLGVDGSVNITGNLTVNNNIFDGNIFRLQDSDGTCDQNPESGSIITSCSSDLKLKEDIRDAGSVLNYFDKIRIRDYTIKTSGDKTTGVIAQEIRETNPELVQDIDGTLFVNLPNPWKLVKAIQELFKSTQELKAENDLLKDRLIKIEKKLDSIELICQT